MVLQMADLDTWSDKIDYPCQFDWRGKEPAMAIQEPKDKVAMFQEQPYVVRNGEKAHLGAVKVSASADLWQGVQSALTAGCLVMLAYTSDGGALCVTVKDGDTRLRTYVATANEMKAAGQELMQRFA